MAGSTVGTVDREQWRWRAEAGQERAPRASLHCRSASSPYRCNRLAHAKAGKILTELLLRFLIGGAVVSFFSLLGDVIRPKSFAGITAAAPTIALASVFLTLRRHGAVYTGIEARSMIAGALAFFVYACAVSFVLMRWRPSALKCAAALLPLWGAVAGLCWAAWLRR